MCSSPLLVTIFRIINVLIDILKIAVPLVMIIMGSMDFAKSTVSGNPDDIKKSFNSLLYRFIAAALIFFLPAILKIFVGIVSPTTDQNSIFCFAEVNEQTLEKAYVDAADEAISRAEEDLSYGTYSVAKRYVSHVKDENSKEALNERLSTLKKEMHASNEEQRKIRESAAIKNAQEAAKKQAQNSSSSSSNISAGNTQITGDEDYLHWKQGDPRWGSVALGNSNMATVGCFITSIAKQMKATGLATSELNPGTLGQKFNSYGGLDSGGGLLWNDHVRRAMSELSNGKVTFAERHDITGTYEQRAAKLAEFINKGYYPVTEIKEYNGLGHHYVAVIRIEGSKIYVSDPANGYYDELHSINQAYMPGEVRLIEVKGW